MYTHLKKKNGESDITQTQCILSVLYSANVDFECRQVDIYNKK